MSRHRTFPLRELTPEERQFLICLRRSATAPASQVARAKALLAVADGDGYVAPLRRRDGVLETPWRPEWPGSIKRDWPPPLLHGSGTGANPGEGATSTGSDSGRHCGLVD
ncbi:MAG: hypothetical protein ACXWT1_03980 [Methylobacter sp.]